METLKRIKVIETNSVHDAFQIGYQDYPNQMKIESLNYLVLLDKRQKLNQSEGYWLIDIQKPIYKIYDKRNITISDLGVNYDNVLIDMCTPFDRNNQQIFVGDQIYVAVKNEVRLVTVTKIAKQPYLSGYGIYNRKLTVFDKNNNQTITINNPFATIKIV
jgi:hypothetical protein